MPTHLKNLTEEQLQQALKDNEEVHHRLTTELACRARLKLPSFRKIEHSYLTDKELFDLLDRIKP